jgi:hypothetical protein
MPRRSHSRPASWAASGTAEPAAVSAPGPQRTGPPRRGWRHRRGAPAQQPTSPHRPARANGRLLSTSSAQGSPTARWSAKCAGARWQAARAPTRQCQQRGRGAQQQAGFRPGQVLAQPPAGVARGVQKVMVLHPVGDRCRAVWARRPLFRPKSRSGLPSTGYP